jgi:capsular polysaccharide transport system permease protein
MKTLKANISDLKTASKRLKEELSGNLKPNIKLNTAVFDYKVLENEMEFAKEVYKETLINQEKLKIEVSQNAKHLSIVTKPTKPDTYTYPDKIWDIFTLILVLVFFYTIVMTAIAIVRDHVD